MLQDIKDFLKLDKISMFVILFWTLILNLIFFLVFGLVLPDMGKVFTGGLFAGYLLWIVYVTGLKSKGILQSVVCIVIFYFIGSFMAYLSIALMILPFGGIIEDSPWIALVIFIAAMLSPYLMLLISLISRQYRVLLNLRRDRIRVGLSVSTAFVTILYAISPLLTFDEMIIQILQVAFFTPFAINILGICFIEYVNLAEKETKYVNNYDA